MKDLIHNIKELRDKTGLAVLDIKNTLIETNNDIDAAYKLLSHKASQLKQTEEVFKQEKISAFYEEMALPLDKSDFYSLTEKIESLEYKLESIEYLLNELLETVKNT